VYNNEAAPPSANSTINVRRRIDRERILILITSIVDNMSDWGSDLLLYHLKGTLGRLLPELSGQEQIDLDEQVRIPKTDIEEALTFLAEII